MACFLVPAAEAAVVTIIRKIAEDNQQKKYSALKVHPEEVLKSEESVLHKTRWLTNLLWGGSALLAFEHVWHGEVTPWFPFLTAMREPDSTSAMLHEMATNGIGMAALVTLVWTGMLAVNHIRNKKNIQEAQ
ncbi:MAG: hypothetical protein IJ644_03385 [Oscillospiraceae bacterium]|nr:hypothetical protein [Oscillospiraceae bacterium]